MKISLLLALACFLMGALAPYAPVGPSTASATDFSPHWREWHAPLTTDAQYILYGGVLSTAVTYLNRSHQSYRESRSYIESRPFGRWGIVGDLLGLGALNGGYILTQLLASQLPSSSATTDLRRAQQRSHAAFMAKATFYPMTWALLLKYTVHERRPGYPDDTHSFPSGHATASFAFSSSVAILHGWKWGALAYTLSSFIAITRLNDDYHYLHDVLMGASLGASYAWGLHFQEKGHSTHTYFGPDMHEKGPMISWKYIY